MTEGKEAKDAGVAEVQRFMVPPLILKPKMRISEVLAALNQNHSKMGVLVDDNDRFKGIITADDLGSWADLAANLNKPLSDVPLDEHPLLFKPSPSVLTAKVAEPVGDALKRMRAYNVNRAVVLKDDSPVGVFDRDAWRQDTLDRLRNFRIRL